MDTLAPGAHPREVSRIFPAWDVATRNERFAALSRARTRAEAELTAARRFEITDGLRAFARAAGHRPGASPTDEDAELWRRLRRRLAG